MVRNLPGPALQFQQMQQTGLRLAQAIVSGIHLGRAPARRLFFGFACVVYAVGMDLGGECQEFGFQFFRINPGPS